MATIWETVKDAPLYDEHLLLGGTFAGNDQLLAMPIHYGDPASEHPSFREGCALVDLSGMSAMLVHGAGADSFVHACCAQAPLAVGECGFGAVVTGDGSIASVPLVARTGDTEYLLWDPLERGLMLQPWLGFLAAIEQDGYRPYEGVSVEDVSDALVPLLLWGPHATAVLGDYVRDLAALPAPGTVANVTLDRIETLVAALPGLDVPGYLLLVPPRAARVLWRSLLSFPIVTPVGSTSLASHAQLVYPWMEHALLEGRLELALEQLVAWELARAEADFIGARALGERRG